VIGVDPNFGGDDRFVAQVWDLSGGVPSLVAEYAEAQRSVELSTMAVLDFCDRYKPVLVAVEGNSGGKVVLENLSKRRPFVRFENINTSRVSKVTNTDRIAIAVEQSEAIYPKDWEGVREMKYFSLREREAITGHDDRVMAMAMAFAVLDAASVTSRISYGAPAIW
jgi:phage terminase large subunit-like protein